MDTPSSVRQPLQEIGNRYLPAKMRHKSNSSSPASLQVKKASDLSSSPPRSSRSTFALFTSSPGPLSARASSIASSPPPSTPHDSPKHLDSFKDVLAISSIRSPAIEHVNLELSSQTITIMIGKKVHIGRKLKKLEESIRRSIDCEEDSIRLVTIPKAAKHASRHHCSLKLHESNELGKSKLDLQVFGQNGMQLQGVKIPQGQKELQVTNGDIISLGFYTDFEVKVVCQAHVTANARVEREESTLPSVPTSEATLGLDLDLDSEHEDEEEKIEPEQAEENVHEEEEREEEEEEQVDIKSMSRKSSISLASIVSSPASVSAKRRQDSRESSHQPVKRLRLSSEVRSSPAPSPYAHQDDDGYPPEDSSESEDEAEIERRKEAQSQEAYSRVKSAIATLSLDLVGILASGIVFQPRATLTTTECIQLLLESQPSLRDHGAAEAWRPSVLAALRSGPFGVIENEGLKDAAGKRVEPDWHYSPELDKDKERKASLQPFVKSIRSTQRQKKQYFFKRPSDLKSRRW